MYLLPHLNAKKRVTKPGVKKHSPKSRLKTGGFGFLGSRYPASLIKANADKLQLLWGTSKGTKVISPDAAATLRELSKRGYLLGTISHTSPNFLEGTGVPELLSTVIYASKFGRRKPHPSLFLAAARECKVNPEECMYVGDRPSRDVIGSREAGIGKVVTISAKDQEPETEVVPMQPDYQISNLAELLDILPSRLNGNEINKNDAYFLYDAAPFYHVGNQRKRSLIAPLSKGPRVRVRQI